MCISEVADISPTQETSVLSPGWEDLLEDDMATHSSILAQRIPWTEESGGIQSIGSQRVGVKQLSTQLSETSIYCLKN